MERLVGVRISVVVALLVAMSAPALAGQAESLIARSRAAEAKGEFDDAVVMMQAAVVADPSRADTYVALGDLYARHDDPQFAHKYYDEALYLDPALPAALEGMGKADLALGDQTAAEADLERLKKSCPNCEQTRALEAALKAPIDSQADAVPPPMDKH